MGRSRQSNELRGLVSICEVVLHRKGKLGYLTGERSQPDEKDPSYSTWEEEHAMVMSWILNFMTPDVSASFVFLPNAHDIWVSVQHIYHDNIDPVYIFELWCRGCDIRQHGRSSASLATYYSTLFAIWQELDFLDPPCQTKTAAGDALLKQFIEEDPLFHFLMGLDPGLGHLRDQVLAQKPLPNLCEAYGFIRSEELREATNPYNIVTYNAGLFGLGWYNSL